MSVSVVMPQLGESVTEGTVTRWLKKEGEHVTADEPLLEVSTDKVDTEIPSPATGILRGIAVDEDETVAVGAQLAVIEDADAASAPEPARGPCRAGGRGFRAACSACSVRAVRARPGLRAARARAARGPRARSGCALPCRGRAGQRRHVRAGEHLVVERPAGSGHSPGPRLRAAARPRPRRVRPARSARASGPGVRACGARRG